MARTEAPRLAPQNFEAEQSVLGAVLLDDAALAKAANAVTGEDFFHAAHQNIFRAMLDLSEHGEAIDSLTLAERLKAKGELESVGGSTYLAELLAGVVSSSNVAHHSKIVADLAWRRRTIVSSSRLIDGLYEGRELASLERDLERLLTRRVTASAEQPPVLVPLATVTPRAMQWLWPGRIPCGKLAVLDDDPGRGKSLLTLDLAARVSRGAPMPDGTTGHLGGPRGVILISAEDDPADTIRPRLDAAQADVTRTEITTFAERWRRWRPWRPRRVRRW